MTYNPQSYAVSLEHKYHLPLGDADKIRRDPMGYFKGWIDKEYDKSSEKAALIDAFDKKYGSYEGKKLDEMTEELAVEFVKDLADILENPLF